MTDCIIVLYDYTLADMLTGHWGYSDLLDGWPGTDDPYLFNTGDLTLLAARLHPHRQPACREDTPSWCYETEHLGAFKARPRTGELG